MLLYNNPLCLPFEHLLDIEVYISSDLETLGQIEPTTESRIVREEVFVLPCGKKEDYVVQVEGFSDAPGGIVETERLTPGHTKDNITLGERC